MNPSIGEPIADGTGARQGAPPARHVLLRLNETGLTVADETADVRGRKVFDANGEEIGKVEDLLIDEDEYRELQKLGEFDLKTSSWVATPPEVRKLGGAIFCDRRFDRVFTYHNGAESYYAARGFRGKVKV